MNSTTATATLPVANKPSLGRGYVAAIAAFAIWGVFPIYLIGLRNVSAMQITAHRITWSVVFVFAWLAVAGELGKVREAVTRPGVLTRLVASAFFITVNWVGFAWAATNHHVLEVSLAYFMGPLLNILLGVGVLRERLTRTQWIAVAFAAAGVAYLSFIAGRTPWIALIVGSSFALYGLIRKTTSVEALSGLAIETILLLPFAAGYLIWCEMTRVGSFGHTGPLVMSLLLAGGAITSIPLVLFAFGAKLVPYSTIGVIQFTAPTLQLIFGLVIFHESIGAERITGFVLIWIGLLIYAAHALWSAKR